MGAPVDTIGKDLRTFSAESECKALTLLCMVPEILSEIFGNTFHVLEEVEASRMLLRVIRRIILYAIVYEFEDLLPCC